MRHNAMTRVVLPASEDVPKTEIDLIKSGNSDQSGIEILKKGIDKIINCEIVDFESYRELLEQYQTDTETGTTSKASIEPPIQTPAENPEDTKTTQIVLSMMEEITLPLQAQYKSTLLFDKVWEPMLLQIALSEGLNSSTWIKKVQTVKTQVWALTPKTTEYDHQKLMTIIPHVSRSLVRAMNFLDLAPELQTSLNEHLKQEQAKVVKSTEINIKPLRRSPKAETRPRQAKHNNKKAIDEVKNIISDSDASTSTTTTNLESRVPDNQTQEASNTREDVEIRASEADKLKLGDWVEIEHENSAILVKLTWRSEDSSMFIFVDREGNRLREVDGATLDKEIATGQVKVTHAEPESSHKSRLSFFNILKS
jgi:hypothetical protein